MTVFASSYYMSKCGREAACGLHWDSTLHLSHTPARAPIHSLFMVMLIYGSVKELHSIKMPLLYRDVSLNRPKLCFYKLKQSWQIGNTGWKCVLLVQLHAKILMGKKKGQITYCVSKRQMLPSFVLCHRSSYPVYTTSCSSAVLSNSQIKEGNR